MHSFVVAPNDHSHADRATRALGMTERSINQDPVLISICLPAAWSANINQATDKLRARFPDKPDAELLEIIFVSGLDTILHQ
jgi:hypothetical protein